MPQKIRAGGSGKEYEFPAEADDALIARWLAQHDPPPAERSTVGDLADVGKGVLKGGGRLAFDLAALDPGPQGQVLRAIGAPTILRPTNPRQAAGMFGADVASLATPAGAHTTGARVVPRLAMRLLRRAIPGVTESAAGQMLARGAGRISEKSAQVLAKEAKATPEVSSIMVQRGGRWVPREVKPSKLQPAADAMREAASAREAPITMSDLLNLTGRGAIGSILVPGHPVLGATIGAATQLARRPRAQSAVAQGLYSAAPALQGVAGGSAALIARALASLLGGGESPDRALANR